MKKSTISCIALAVVLGACLTAQAQTRNWSQQFKRGIANGVQSSQNQNRSRDRDDDDDDDDNDDPRYKTVYDIRIEPAFKGHVVVAGEYQATWRARTAGLGDVVAQDNFSQFTKDTFNPMTPKWLKGVDPKAKVTFYVSCRAHFLGSNTTLLQPDSETINLANYATGGKRYDVELASSQFRVRMNFKIYERQVRIR